MSPKEIKPYLKSARRWFFKKYDDVNWFRRGRICLSCNKGFLTAEVEETFLTELTELRDALAEVKRNTETYFKRANDAADSLGELNQSLEKLRALKSYEDEKTDPI